MPNPFNAAQAQSADSGYGYQPAAPSADMSGAQAAPAGSMAPPAPSPSLFQGSATELGQFRDSIMSQFPDINDLGEDEGFTPAQKFGLIAIALANPQGALDMVRQKQERALKKRQLAAEFNMKALTLGSHVMDAQHQVSLGLAQLHQRQAEAKMENDRGIASNETQRGMLRVQQTRADLERMQSDREAQGQNMGMDLLNQGTDESGQEVSSPYGTPGFTSRAESQGLSPSFGQHGVEVGLPTGRNAKPDKNLAQVAEQLLTSGRARTPERAMAMATKIVGMRTAPPSLEQGVAGSGGGGGVPSMDPAKLPQLP